MIFNSNQLFIHTKALTFVCLETKFDMIHNFAALDKKTTWYVHIQNVPLQDVIIIILHQHTN